MAESAPGWLLEWPAHPLVFAVCEVVEVVDRPEIHQLPFGPAWCQALLYWRDTLIPLAAPGRAQYETLSIVVVAFQSSPGTALQHAAIPVMGHPRRIEVPDGCDCAPPENAPFSEDAIHACLQFNGRSMLVPDLATLFGARAATDE